MMHGRRNRVKTRPAESIAYHCHGILYSRDQRRRLEEGPHALLLAVIASATNLTCRNMAQCFGEAVECASCHSLLHWRFNTLLSLRMEFVAYWMHRCRT